MPSGAGLNRGAIVLLRNVQPSCTALANPLAGYGLIGVNDSGGYAIELQGFTKFKIQIVPVGATAVTGYTVTCYDTVDPAAWDTFINAGQGKIPASANPFPPQLQGFTNATGYSPGVPPSSWVQTEGPSQQAGTGSTMANPIVFPTSSYFVSSSTTSALRVCVTALASPTGTFNVVCLGVP